jgi:hypothetical protein
MYYGIIYEGAQAGGPMMKLTFIKGESESKFVAAGAYYQDGRYWDYKIAGSWSPPLEDGKIPVKMKMNEYIVLEGTFDPEENSMRGETTETFRTPRAFVFKRDPGFVRFYSAPCVVNARARWEFATTSVLDRIRQRAWSSQRILKRMKDGRRFMDLTLRGHYGRRLEMEESDEASTLFPGLYESDARFYRSLINVHLKETTIFE